MRNSTRKTVLLWAVVFLIMAALWMFGLLRVGSAVAY
jgi:hypothetical protein